MQKKDGTFTQLTQEEIGNLNFVGKSKVLKEGMIFKVKRCYFRLSKITQDGIVAKGISRKEYYDLKRGRPDWV